MYDPRWTAGASSRKFHFHPSSVSLAKRSISVSLRNWKRSRGKTRLYLAVNIRGKRAFQALHFCLSQDKTRNKETQRLAEAIQATRELEAHAEAEGLPDSDRRKQILFALAEQTYDH